MSKALVVFLLGLLTTSSAFAGTYSGVIMPYWYHDALYIGIGGSSASGIPACSTRSIVKLAETDPNDPVYKAKYAMLLGSWLAQRPVTLVGWGTCTVEGDEIIYEIYPTG